MPLVIEIVHVLVYNCVTTKIKRSYQIYMYQRKLSQVVLLHYIRAVSCAWPWARHMLVQIQDVDPMLV